MSKKHVIGKKGKPEKDEPATSKDEAEEIQMILDRLAVQDPEGESFERYLQTLRNALGNRPHMAVALLDRLSRNPGPAGFRTFKTLEAVAGNSPHKRMLKQAAYRFSQRGYSTEEKAVPKKVVLIQQGEARHPTAHFFLVQGALWLIAAMVPESGPSPYTLVTAFLEDDYESFSVKVVDTTQKFYREYLQNISRHATGSKALEIPARHAARLFFEMLDLCTAENLSAEVEQGRGIFKRYLEPDGKPHVYDLMDEIADPERYFSEIDLASLFETMDASWLRFSKEDLAPVHEKLKGLASPLIVVAPEVRVERRKAIIRGAADSLCTGKTRLIFQRFFEEQAMGFKLLRMEEKARWAWILAQHFAGSSPAGENPAAFELVIHSIESHWPGELDGPESEAEHQHHREERRTPSGIILP